MSLIWIILIATMVASFIVQQTLNSRFKKYGKVALPSGLSGAEVARRMLADHGINSVQVVRGSGFLTDHFDPSARVIKLSPEVYDGRSIAAAAVAAHECGHAVQHSRGYMPLKLRSALVPVVNFANSAVTWLLLLGVLAIQCSGHPHRRLYATTICRANFRIFHRYIRVSGMTDSQDIRAAA